MTRTTSSIGRWLLLLLPQCGVFYGAREHRSEEVGMFKSLVALNMSWLRLERMVGADGTGSYSFGKGSYVKKFYSERKSCVILCEQLGFCGASIDGTDARFSAESGHV